MQSRSLLPSGRAHLKRNRLRVQEVVGVQEEQILALCYCDAGITRRCKTGVFLMHVTDSFSIPCTDLGGLIIGAIVYHDNVDGRVGSAPERCRPLVANTSLGDNKG